MQRLERPLQILKSSAPSLGVSTLLIHGAGHIDNPGISISRAYSIDKPLRYRPNIFPALDSQSFTVPSAIADHK